MKALPSALDRLVAALTRRVAAPRRWGYSDDTEMAIGVAESLVAHAGVVPEELLRTLARDYDPARGYGKGGKGMKLIVRRLAEGAPWQSVAATAWPEGSWGNGVAVRVGPIACLYHDDDAALRAAVVAGATITHAHPEAIAWASVLARAVAFLLRLPAPEVLRADALLADLPSNHSTSIACSPSNSAFAPARAPRSSRTSSRRSCPSRGPPATLSS